MILKRIRVESFGKLKDLTLEPSAGLNHFCRPNEFGKTTLMTFIYFILYGYDSKWMKSYFPWDGAPLSGSITLSLGEEEWQIFRHHPQKGAERQQVMELSSGRELILAAREKPGPKLLGLDGETFLRTFFVRQGELFFDRTDGLDTALKNLAATGDENASYQDAIDYLTKEHNRYRYRTRAQGPLLDLQAAILNKSEALGELEREIEAQIAQKQEYEALEQKKAALEEQLSRLEERLLQAKKNDAARRVASLLKLESASSAKPRSEAEDAALSEQEQAFLKLGKAEEGLKAQKEQIAYLEREHQSARQRMEGFYLPADTGERLLKFEQGRAGGLIFGILLLVLGIAAALGTLLIKGLWILGALLLLGGIFLCLREPIAKGQFCRHCGAADLKGLRERWEHYLGAKEQVAALEQALLEAKEKQAALERDTAQERENLQRLTLITRLLSMEELKQEQFDRAVHRQTAENTLQQQEELLKGRSLAQWQEEAAGGDPEGEPYEQVFAEKQKALSALSALMEALPGKEVHALSALWKKAEGLRAELQQAREQEQEWKRALAAAQCSLRWMEEANEDMARHFAPRLCKDAGEALSLLTDGAYQAVQMDDQYNIRLETAAGAYPIGHFSKGTKDAVYFAFRLAVGRLISEIPLPLMLDDPFVNLDVERLEEAQKMLKTAAKERQILYFTCRD